MWSDVTLAYILQLPLVWCDVVWCGRAGAFIDKMWWRWDEDASYTFNTEHHRHWNPPFFFFFFSFSHPTSQRGPRAPPRQLWWGRMPILNAQLPFTANSSYDDHEEAIYLIFCSPFFPPKVHLLGCCDWRECQIGMKERRIDPNIAKREIASSCHVASHHSYTTT